MICEKSPGYLHSGVIPKRIYKYNSNMKFIFILRDPVKRAYSHYLMHCRSGIVLHSFEEKIKRELNHKNFVDFNKSNYLEWGRYAEQINNFLEYFDKSNMLFIISEKFREDKNKTLKKIFNFLEVDQNCEIADLSERNLGFLPRYKTLSYIKVVASFLKLKNNEYFEKPLGWLDDINKNKAGYPPMNDRIKELLKKYYKPYNQNLSELINIDSNDYWCC